MDRFRIRVKAKIEIYTDVDIDAPSLNLAQEEALVQAQSLSLEAWEAFENIDELHESEFDFEVLDEESMDDDTEYDDGDGIPYSRPPIASIPSRTPIDSPRMRLVDDDYEPVNPRLESGSVQCQLD